MEEEKSFLPDKQVERKGDASMRGATVGVAVEGVSGARDRSMGERCAPESHKQKRREERERRERRRRRELSPPSHSHKEHHQTHSQSKLNSRR
jgi:hypothetical protein